MARFEALSAGARELLDPLVTISSISQLAIGSGVGSLGTWGSAGWIAANRAIYVPFRISRAITVVNMFIINGVTANGNVDIGIYNDSLAAVWRAGSTAQSGTDAVQFFAVANQALAAGMYYMGLVMASATQTTVLRTTTNVNRLRAYGIVQEASALPLPATMTPAALASAFIPLFGLSTRSVV